MQLLRTYRKATVALAIYTLLVFSGLVIQFTLCTGCTPVPTEIVCSAEEGALQKACCSPKGCSADCCVSRTIVLQADCDFAPSPHTISQFDLSPELLRIIVAEHQNDEAAKGIYQYSIDYPPPLLKRDVQAQYQVFRC